MIQLKQLLLILIVVVVCQFQIIDAAVVATRSPTQRPTTARPTAFPTSVPSSQPTSLPTGQPTGEPTGQPTGQPTSQPSGIYIQAVEDDISFSTLYYQHNINNISSVSNSTLMIQANGDIYIPIKANSKGQASQLPGIGGGASRGHFRYVFNWFNNGLNYQGTTECIQIGENVADILPFIYDTNITISSSIGSASSSSPLIISTTTMKKLVGVINSPSGVMDLRKYYNAAAFQTAYSFTVRNRGIVNITEGSIGFNRSQCNTPRVLRQWEDASTWDIGRVPNEWDGVILTEKTGVLALTQNLKIRKLSMAGGTIIGHKTACPDGWSISPVGKTTSKCYKLFQNASTFDEAEHACRNTGLSSVDSHLVSIRSREELQVVKRLCRGNNNSPSYLVGCWIGLRYSNTDGVFSWQERVPSQAFNYNNTWVDWARFGGQAADNVTVSNGLDTIEGSPCTAIVQQWQDDPLSEEQGSYIRSGCVVRRPYICQINAKTTKYQVAIRETTTFTGASTLIGGQYVLKGKENQIESLLMQSAASLTLTERAYDTYVATLVMEDACLLDVYANMLSTIDTAYPRPPSPFLSTVADLSQPYSFYTLSQAHNSIGENIRTYADPVGAELVGSSAVFVGERYSIGVQSVVQLRDRVEWNMQVVNGATASSSSMTVFPSGQPTGQPSGQPTGLPTTQPTVLTGFTPTTTATAVTTDATTLVPDIYLSNEKITVNARVEYLETGQLTVSSGISARFLGGASLSTAYVEVSGATSEVVLQGYGSRLSTYDSYDLTLSHRGPVLGEYTFVNPVEDNPKDILGVYRLQISDFNASTQEITQCIPYNISAASLANILNESSLVMNRGGVTVRRTGDGNDPSFGFGYTYRIELDSPLTENYFINGSSISGSLSIGVYCYGISGLHDCGCAETKVPLLDHTGTERCPTQFNISRSDPYACVLEPSITVTQLSVLSYTRTLGQGRILIDGGMHRLPPVSTIVLGAQRGSGIVSASNITWKGFQATGTGQIIMAGTSWLGWDSVIDLYFSPLWEVHRRDLLLNVAPAFTMTSETFLVQDFGAVLTSCPGSQLIWGSGVWNGGIIGGRSTIMITSAMHAGGLLKALRYSNELIIMPTATLYWSSGNFSLANGAILVVEGNFDISVVEVRGYFGNAALLESPDPAQRTLLEEDPGRQSNFYYDDNLPQKYREGWYINPTCGDSCLDSSYIEIRAQANVSCVDGTNVTFMTPLNLIDQTQLKMGLNNVLELYNGGNCGDDVVMNIGAGTVFTLSGGSMHMEQRCTVKGAGELIVIGGEHDLGLSIDAHITIQEGTMIWPRRNDPGITINFNGGLLIEKVGILKIEPLSTTIVVYNDVVLKDRSQVLFPAIGIAAQPSVFDRADAPDSSPRGNLTSVDRLYWDSGLIYGKVDIFAERELYLTGGEKTIRFLAKLVNKGHAEWSSGDIVTEFSADFVNKGSLQMSGNVSVTTGFDGNAVYKGTVAPMDAGGDPFAMDYHSWDSDFGHLSYTEYLNLRTEFVSRAPSSYVRGAPPEQPDQSV